MPTHKLTCLALVLFCLHLCASAVRPTLAADAAWTTHRGNVARTGNIDGVPGPMNPKVLWAQASAQHFVASPVAAGDTLYVSGLGAFNTAALHAITLGGEPAHHLRWTKSAPFLKLPVVSAPAVVGGKLVFGDGMHQTDGAALHCLAADTGRALWRLTVPGHLVHIEGAPAVVGQRAVFGAGQGGVICVDMNRVTLDGKEQPLEVVRVAIERKWNELLARYEADKKKDPDFAIPPSEDALPKPEPKVLWEQGKGQWHVDSAVLADGARVYAASAYLDMEKTGQRALYAMDMRDGRVLWSTPLKLNPWAGPTLGGDVLIVGGSSIRFDPKEIPAGRGDVVAIAASDGAVRWHRDVAGGVVSPIAVAAGLAVFTATDGRVRALDAAGGADRWSYDAGAPMFAGPAVVAGVVYVADLHGVVHALRLADGKPIWRLDLAADPAVKSAAMVYGSPVVHKGLLYLATCNLEGPQGQRTAIVCIGNK